MSINPVPCVGEGQKFLQASFWLDCSKTSLVADLPIVFKYKFSVMVILSLLFRGRGRGESLSSVENPNFFGTELPLDLRPVCKFEFIRCGPVKKNRVLSLFNRVSSTKFMDTFF